MTARSEALAAMVAQIGQRDDADNNAVLESKFDRSGFCLELFCPKAMAR